MKVVSIGPPPRLIWIGGKQWRLFDPYEVHIKDDDGNTWSIRVKEGFVTDGPSVPGFLSSFFPTRGASFHASIFHDHIYSIGKESWKEYGFGRKEADKVFKIIAEDLGVGDVTSFWGWLGVRIGGWTKY